MIRYAIIILILLFSIFVRWYQEPSYIQENQCTIEDLVDDIEALEKAMLKMGPLYQYTVDTDGTLRVNRGDNKLLKVRY
jgi:beta-lactam-binding protein with PASTA domain